MDIKSEHHNHLEHFSKAMNMFRDRTIQVLMYMLFRVARGLVISLQKFTWAVLGVERTRRDAARGLQFKQSCHVQEIFWRRKFLEHSVADPSYFITTHKCFKPPNYIFKPNVSLYCMTRREAVFVETAESDNLYKSSQSYYLHQCQYQHAVNLITMPLASFHKMAKDVGAPRVPVTWLACTQRSGATLLSQMMYRIPGTLVLCEPDAITTLGRLYRKSQIQPSEYRQLLAGCVKLLCKPDDRYSAVLVKGRPMTTSLVEDIGQEFPRFRYLFMYRNSVKSLMTNLAQFQLDPAPKVFRFLMDSPIFSALLPILRSRFYYHHVFLNEKKLQGLNTKKLDTVGILTAAWASNISQVADLRYKGYNIGSILYEDFMINPRRSLALLMAMLDIRKEHLGPAAEALKADINISPSDGAGGMMDQRRALLPQDRAGAEMVLKAYGLAKLGERFEVAGLLKLE